MFRQPPTAPTASAVGPCPTVIQSVGRPGTGSLPSTIAPPDHPHRFWDIRKTVQTQFRCHRTWRLIRFTTVCLQEFLCKIE